VPGAGAGDVGAIVVAAGRGDRFGAAKQFLELDRVRLVDRAVRSCSDACGAVVVVLPAGATWDGPTVHAAVSGGATRSDSVRAGLAALPASVDVVVVHDAARPLASRAIFEAVIDAIRAGADAAVPALPIADTLKRVDTGARVTETVARDDLVAVQTPQAFRLDALRAAHASDADATDDAALVEQRGGCVVVVPGEVTNFKITSPSDLELAAAVLAARGGAA
jgi:2-C-methyl-D-erythritol 4-phosphate cytidylyltransferase